jgi:predicted CXXCH cytochrome family protein
VKRGTRTAVLPASAIATAMLFAAALSARASPPAQCVLHTVDRATAATSVCTSCLGPSLAPQGRSARFQMPGRAFGHPVDVDYDAARGARPDRFKARSELPSTLPLVGGKIACTTCHSARSTIQSSLAMSADGALCLSCHVLDSTPR